MKKVISIALFGEGDKYSRYLPAFVRAHLNLFPIEEGWKLRVHWDGDYYKLQKYHFAGLIEARHMESAPLTKAMLWRLDPVFDPSVDFVFCRDLDAPPMPRDRACCEEFIKAAPKTKCSVHTIHDNVMHVGIMGGLCGFHAPAFRDVTGFKTLNDLCKAAAHTDAQWAQHGADQIALNNLLLKQGGPRLFEHRYNGWHAGVGTNLSRAVGKYACGGVSSPVSNAASRYGRQADLLGNHLGCAGYDHDAAVKFWDEHGDREIAAAVKACE